VTAWRLAWKLAQAGRPVPPDFRDGDLANITVVDDRDKRVRSYVTGEYHVYHPYPVGAGTESSGCKDTGRIGEKT
jgi:hypothetical protein